MLFQVPGEVSALLELEPFGVRNQASMKYEFVSVRTATAATCVPSIPAAPRMSTASAMSETTPVAPKYPVAGASPLPPVHICRTAGIRQQSAHRPGSTRSLRRCRPFRAGRLGRLYRRHRCRRECSTRRLCLPPPQSVRGIRWPVAVHCRRSN